MHKLRISLIHKWSVIYSLYIQVLITKVQVAKIKVCQHNLGCVFLLYTIRCQNIFVSIQNFYTACFVSVKLPNL